MSCTKKRRCAAWIAALALLAAPAGAVTVRVTAVDGETSAGDDALDQHRELGDGDVIETDEGGNCSLLLADDAVIQVCNGARLILRTGPDGSPILDLSRGELKATVAPRSADQPLEIHTPAAIATILGTVAHVFVDPDTGESVVTSLDSRIGVAGVAAPDAGVAIDTGQQVTVAPNRIPGPVRRVDPRSLQKLSACLDDEALRGLAADLERERRAAEELDAIAVFDIPDSLPGVAAPGDALLSLVNDGRGIDPLDVCFAGGPCDAAGRETADDVLGAACIGASCNLIGPPDPPLPCDFPGDQCQRP